MSLSSAYSIGRTGLMAGQLGIQVSGNNIANANTAGFTRQRLDMAPLPESGWGALRFGNGVNVLGTRPIVDRALQYRLWQGTSDNAAANADQQRLDSLESILNPLNDTNLSQQVGAFFDAWSTLTTRPNDATTRSMVVQQGQSIAGSIQSMRDQLAGPERDLSRELGQSVTRMNSILQQIAGFNDQIARNGAAGSSGLNDARGQLITELAGFMDLTVNEQPNGTMDISVGSTNLVTGSNYQALQQTVETVNGQEVKHLATVGQTSETLNISSGRLGALLRPQTVGAADTIHRLDVLAAQLINMVNRAYSVGSNGNNRSSYTSSLVLPTADQTLSFNNPANQTMAGLSNLPTSGRVVVRVRNNTTGASEQTAINIDLDGLDAANNPGFGNDTSPASFAAGLNGVANLTATVGPDGKIQITAVGGYSVSFTEDTSGVLSTLGINTYFTGHNASDIGVQAALSDTPADLNAASVDASGNPVDNGVAMAVAGLRDQPIDALGSVTMQDYWGVATQQVSAALQGAKTTAESTDTVKSNLETQRQAISGVSLDEEAINLIQFQSQYQASARYISILQQVTQALIQMA
jgi:flagellar hook-associated protein 1 FlgK